MGQEVMTQQKVIEEYNQFVIPLLEYLPWLEEKVGEDAYSLYEEEGIGENSLTFPVYEETLLNLIRQLSESPLTDRNYRYVYTRNHLETTEDERAVIQGATWRDWGILKGILSRYVAGGRTKGMLWSQAVREDIFYLVLLQMRKICEGEGEPLAL